MSTESVEATPAPEPKKQIGYRAEAWLGFNDRSIYIEKIMPADAAYEKLIAQVLTGSTAMSKFVNFKSITPIKMNEYSWRADGQLVEFEFTAKIRMGLRVTETDWEIEEGGSKE